MGLAAADMLAGHYLVEGILSSLVKSINPIEGSKIKFYKDKKQFDLPVLPHGDKYFAI